MNPLKSRGNMGLLLVALSMEPLSGSAATMDDWPMLAHDSARSGATSTQVHPPFSRKWFRLFPDEGIQSGVQPIITTGKVFLGTLAGVMHALDAQTGEDVWRFSSGGPILHAAASDRTRVFFGSADGCIYAVDIDNGKMVWRFDTGTAVWNSPAIHEELLLAGTRDGRVLSLKTASGALKWEAILGAPVLNSPAVDASRHRLYVAGEDMRVRSLDLQNGKVIWTSEPLPGATFRGYHPVIAPDGSVMITSEPVASYDRFQDLLMEMAREVFGDIASWRHKKDENSVLREQNFRQLENPETYRKELAFLRTRLEKEPAFQTFFVLDPESGRQRFVAPIVASESMNGPGAPPLVTSDGRVIVKYQVLLRSRYEHYSPFMNVGYLDTATGHITPIMDQTRTYGWHDSLLLVHDEQCQLSAAGRILLNTHQDNVNALDLDTLKGFAQPFAVNIHEPARGEALAIRLDILRGKQLSPGNEWLIRGTAVYGGGSVLDEPVAIAGDSFYYIPTHELNSGCALVAYRSDKGAEPPKRIPLPAPNPTRQELEAVQDYPWDWDSLASPRLKNFLESLPAPIPGTAAAPKDQEADELVSAIVDSDLDRWIWTPAFDPSQVLEPSPEQHELVSKLQAEVQELLAAPWQPLVTPGGKAPDEAHRYFSDPAQTIFTLLLAHPFLDANLRAACDRKIQSLVDSSPRGKTDSEAPSRASYTVPFNLLRIGDGNLLDDLSRLYPLWLWSRIPAGAGLIETHWAKWSKLIPAQGAKMDHDCGNARLAGLIAYCRMAKVMNDETSVAAGLAETRNAMRARLKYEFAYTRGGLISQLPHAKNGMVRWRNLFPDVGKFLGTHAGKINRKLMSSYVDYQRPGWWIAWNVEQLMRNETPFQSPSTPMEIFTARALILGESNDQLRKFVDIPWCHADEYYIRKIALTLLAPNP